ncbi:hypothetical protein [Xanthobacter dioxanivorans]
MTTIIRTAMVMRMTMQAMIIPGTGMPATPMRCRIPFAPLPSARR